jgi:transcriptional regulator with XRE-family HTH domain
MNWKEHKKRLLNDPEFRAEYESLEPEYKLASTIIRLRLAKGLTQEQLAKFLNTKQESIARLESGGSLPSLSTVKRVAEALDADVEIIVKPKRYHVENSVTVSP